MPPTLTIVGSSVRAAAVSAAKAGFTVYAGDLFTDVDLCRVSHAARVDAYPRGLARVVAGPQSGGWMYTGALENHPALVDRMAAVRPLLGNPGAVLRAVRNPRRLATVLHRAGLRYPAVAFHAAGADLDTPWLCKPRRSAGGSHVGFWDRRSPLKRGWYLQRFATGEPHSAVYLASERRAALLGVTRQLVGEAWCGASGFRYCGSVGPVDLAPRVLETFVRLGEVLAGSFGLAGLFGVDAIVDGEDVWPVEVNPRFTASVEVLERAAAFSATAAHVRACQSQPWSGPPAGVTRQVAGKAVLFAQESFVAGEYPHPPAVANCQLADIPGTGTVIRGGWPIVSLLAEAADEPTVIGQLQRGAREIYSLSGAHAR